MYKQSEKEKIQQKAGNLLHEKIIAYLDDHPGEDYAQVMQRMLDKHPELKKQYAGI